MNYYKKLFSITIFAVLLSLMQSCEESQSKIKTESLTTLPNVSEILKPENMKLDSLAIFSLYSIENKGKYRTFISLSDIYKDSITVPPDIIANQENQSFENLSRIELPDLYRKKLLQGTGLTETDTLFLYNYEHNTLQKFQLKDLKAVAHLNLYSSEGDQIYDYYYMVGFELKESENKEEDAFENDLSLAAIGKQNPFAQEQLQSIVWIKIQADEFPENDYLKKKDLQIERSVKYDNGDLIYFLQDWKSADYLKYRILIVLDKEKELVYSRLFDNSDEGSGLTQLNGIDDPKSTYYQWTGKLFKGKPPVLFDLENSSFGCPEILFLRQSHPRLYINCDPRH